MYLCVRQKHAKRRPSHSQEGVAIYTDASVKAALVIVVPLGKEWIHQGKCKHVALELK